MRWYARLLVGLAAGVLLLCDVSSGPALAAAQPPLGYERWTDPNAESGVDFGLTPAQVFQKYAASFAPGNVPQTHKRKDKRLIDIEIRADGSGLANYVYDVVWVEDAGTFKLESWFVPGLTESELKTLPQLASQGIAVLDVERYPDGNSWRYSVILQRNAGRFGWQVLTDASYAQVQTTAERNGLRILDLDYVTHGPNTCPPPNPTPGQACQTATFDAILVADSGSNAVETDLHFNMSAAQISQKYAQGYQLVDHEGPAASPYMATVWVKPGLPFMLYPALTQSEVIFQQGHHGRVIDLERPGGESKAPYSIVNLP
ncbi:MAG: hypothetical protein AB7K36_22990 [Chloroflexota bacterium]